MEKLKKPEYRSEGVATVPIAYTPKRTELNSSTNIDLSYCLFLNGTSGTKTNFVKPLLCSLVPDQSFVLRLITCYSSSDRCTSSLL